MRRKKEDAAQTREALIRAGYRVFYRDGLEAARIEDIAQEAGVTRGAFYWHFESKMQLYVEVLRQKMGEFGARRAAIIADKALSDFDKIVELLNLPVACHDIYQFIDLSQFQRTKYPELQAVEDQKAVNQRQFKERLLALLAGIEAERGAPLKNAPEDIADLIFFMHETLHLRDMGALFGRPVDRAQLRRYLAAIIC